MTKEKPVIADPSKHMVARRLAYFFSGLVCLTLAGAFAVAIFADASIVKSLGELTSIISTVILGAFGIIGTYVGTTNWPSKF